MSGLLEQGNAQLKLHQHPMLVTYCQAHIGRPELKQGYDAAIHCYCDPPFGCHATAIPWQAWYYVVLIRCHSIVVVIAYYTGFPGCCLVVAAIVLLGCPGCKCVGHRIVLANPG